MLKVAGHDQGKSAISIEDTNTKELVCIIIVRVTYREKTQTLSPSPLLSDFTERMWGDEEWYTRYRHIPKVYSTSGRTRHILEGMGNKFISKSGGVGDMFKQYWLLANNNKNQKYVFGNKHKFYEISRQHTEETEILELIARKILDDTQTTIDPTHSPFTVVCKYTHGQGVGWHQDNDYHSNTNTVVSMSLIGEADFKVMLGGREINIQLQTGDIVIFERSIKHSAGPAQSTHRVNATVRYARHNTPNIFKHPLWYSSREIRL
jgi:hypothetical protein